MKSIRLLHCSIVSFLLLGGGICSAQTLFVPSGTSGVGSSSTGNVGIGISNPGDKLTVIGNASFLNNANFTAGSNALLLYSGSTPQIYFTRSGGNWADTWWEWTMGTDNKLRLGFCTVPQLTLQNGALGIGTDSPLNRLHVGDGDVRISRSTATYGPNLLLDATGVGSGGVVWGIGSTTTSDIAGSGKLVFYANGGMRAAFDSSGNMGIGTTSPTHKLSVNGTIRAKEVMVDTGWADYVFSDDYRLASLAEVEEHIKAKKHLPGIPSASEVAEHGVSMGDMQARLLAKVEELTLHLIAQEKRFVAQETRQHEQAERISRLEKENDMFQSSHW